MKLFRRNKNSVQPAKNNLPLAPVEEALDPIQVRQISLSAEEKSLLEKPVDPRVERILREMYANKAAAECALNSQRLRSFSSADIGDRHVVQDQDGFWRIVPGSPPESETQLFDAI
jgi:hypothetical protein